MILSRSRGGFVPVSRLVMNFTNKLAAAAPRCCHQQKQIWGNGGGELETTALPRSPRQGHAWASDWHTGIVTWDLQLRVMADGMI